MRPLGYLYWRSFVNGVKRALTSARRLIGLLFFLAYYVFFFIRPFESNPSVGALPPGTPRMELPGLSVLDGIVFALFSLLTVFLALNVAGAKGGFKAADADVLFPTPISPKIVLVFRLVRDYLLTLLLPLFLALVGWRGVNVGVTALFRNFPEEGHLIAKTVPIAWLLMSLAWVCLGYAASLFVGRSDLDSDRNRRIITWTVVAAIGIVGAYIANVLQPSPTWETALQVSHAPLVRVGFFTATFATALAMAPLTGDWGAALFGFGGLVLLVGGSLRIAMTQVGWMYDQAAAKGFDAENSRALQQKGDMYGIMAEQARRGKMKTGRLAAWIGGMKVRGAATLVWKDVLLQVRGNYWTLLLFLVLGLFLVGLPVFAVGSSHRPRAVLIASNLYLFQQGVVAFMVGMGSANSGFIEMLRRVDLQKPLPFKPLTICLMEIFSKTVPVVLTVTVAGLFSLAMRPVLAPYVLASLIMAPAFGLVLVSSVLLVTLLFPDMEDPTQRGFRGLVTLLALAILSSPGLGIAIGLIVFGANPLVAAIPFLIVNGIIAVLASALCGHLYAGFNPSE